MNRVLASEPALTVGRAATSGTLRTIAYHGITDPAAFAAQMRELTRRWAPVGQSRVLRWMAEGEPLPPGAVWVTFDDGDPSVVEHGLPVLAELGVPATMFVCPGLIEAGMPPWWSVVDHAVALGAEPPEIPAAPVEVGPVTRFKFLPDADRRRLVSRLMAEYGPPEAPALTEGHLAQWIDAGMRLGNHTWDHPCLDRCSPSEQFEQIDRAHRWLDERGLLEERVFAYPNGNRTAAAEEALDSLGYRMVALFDHRLTSRRTGPMRWSRLRLDADAPVERMNAVLSGWHGPLLRMATRSRRVLGHGGRP